LEIALDMPVMMVMPPSLLSDLVGASVIAPVVEEGVKGLALLILLLFVRQEIDSPMDGLIYGGLVGFGFAAVENMFYLLAAYGEGGIGGAVGLAFLRAGVFGLNHAMYTAFTGLGIALSLEVRKKVLKPLLILGGFVLAVLAHALHNAFATFAAQWGLVPFLGAIVNGAFGVLILLVVVTWSFFLERKRVKMYAQKLVDLDTIPDDEVGVLTSLLRRRLARLKVLFSGDIARWWRLNRYHHWITEAAFAWHRMTHGDPKARKRLMRLEQKFQSLREEMAPHPQVAVQ
jgi:hypothetical protein